MTASCFGVSILACFPCGTVLSTPVKTEKSFVFIDDNIPNYADMQANNTPHLVSCLNWEEKRSFLPSVPAPSPTHRALGGGRGVGVFGRLDGIQPASRAPWLQSVLGHRTRPMDRLLRDGCMRVFCHGTPWCVRCSKGWIAGVGAP
jgi:hypothetical protein